MSAAWIEQARSLTQSSSVPLGVSVATHMDMLLRDTRRDLRVACDALEAVLRSEGPHGYGDYSEWANGFHAALDAMREVITSALGIETGAGDE